MELGKVFLKKMCFKAVLKMSVVWSPDNSDGMWKTISDLPCSYLERTGSPFHLILIMHLWKTSTEKLYYLSKRHEHFRDTGAIEDVIIISTPFLKLSQPKAAEISATIKIRVNPTILSRPS